MAARAGHGAGRAASARESEESHGDDSAHDTGRRDHCAASAPWRRALCVHTHRRMRVFRGTSEYGRHAGRETGAALQSESAYTPAYVHQSAGAGGTTAARSGSLSGASRYQDDHALRASRAESFARRDSSLGAPASRSTNGTPVILSHAGVTLSSGKRVSAGVPNGI